MKSTIPLGALFISALFAGCAGPFDPYGYTEPAHESWVEPENITLASSDWKDAGADSPEHALETFLWASKTGNADRQQEVTYSRMGYKKEYEVHDYATVKQLEAAPNIGLDESFEFNKISDIEKQSAGKTDEERWKMYEYWLRPYIRGPLAVRNIGTPESPIPVGFVRPGPPPATPAQPVAPVQSVDVPQGRSVGFSYPTGEGFPPGGSDAALYQPKPMLDVTVLANKTISHTEVELDVREHFPAEADHPAAYFYVPCDFILVGGTSWKLINMQGFHVAGGIIDEQGRPKDAEEFSSFTPPTAEERRENPGRPVQVR